MKVVQKRKLLVKDKKGYFVNNETFTILRNRAVIEESAIEESESSYKETGIIWVVDEKATKEREDAKKPKAESKHDVLEFDGLEITSDNIDDFAKDNGISFGNTKDIQKKLDKVKEFINKQ